MGIRLTGEGFQSDAAAQFAGKKAFEGFLNELSRTAFPQVDRGACPNDGCFSRRVLSFNGSLPVCDDVFKDFKSRNH
jgi:hypothetical protein